MDILLPFLPRIAHIQTINERLIIVAGIKQAKVRALNKEAYDYKADGSLREGACEDDAQEQDRLLDTWA